MSEPSVERAALFDMDGTLLWLDVDIEPVRAALAELFAPAGFRERFSPILPTIARAAAAVAATESERADWIRRARALIDDAEVAAATRARAMPGALGAIERACDRRGGVPCGVVTDNGRACVAPALRAAGFPEGAFPVVVTRDEVERSKPDPAGLVGAARALLPRGGRLLWAGDSPRDVAAGLAARDLLRAAPSIDVDVVAVRGGRGADDELAVAGADRVVDELGAAVDWLIH